MSVFLISESYIKANTVLDLNVSGNYLQQAILSAQDIELQGIIGKSMLNCLKDKVTNNTIDGNYKILLEEYIHPYLCHQVLSEIIIPISFKITNAGVVSVEDEKLYRTDYDKLALLKDFYQNKANAYKLRLQNYLIDNHFPELDCDHNLYSSSNCGIFLGGMRGK